MDTTLNARPVESRSQCDHTNPVCECNTPDSKRGEMLKRYLDQVASSGWSDLMLMPLGGNGKYPAIKGQCRLDDPRAEELLHSPGEAVEALKNGAQGFVLYAGRADHGTADLVFTDHDDTELWHPDELSQTLLVQTGSGTGYHGTYRNAGTVKNAAAKDNLQDAGGIRASNWEVVLPGSVHPSGGVYHVERNEPVATLRADDLPPELRPGPGSKPKSSRTGPTSIAPEEIESLPAGFEADRVSNEWGVTLGEIRSVSKKTDRLLSEFNPGNEYPSTSEADMATVAMLLIWGFSEDKIANILRATRARAKMHRDDYVSRSITQTTLTKVRPLDPDLGRALVDSARTNGGQPTAHESTLIETKISLELRAGSATVSNLVDDGVVSWDNAKRKSVLKRTRRALKILEDAGYVSREERDYGPVWHDEGLGSLKLPHE